MILIATYWKKGRKKDANMSKMKQKIEEQSIKKSSELLWNSFEAKQMKYCHCS